MTLRKFYALLIPLSFVAVSATAQQVVNLRVDGAKKEGPMTPIWAWFGYDEPNYTYMKDGRKLLTEIAALSPAPVHIRAHNLMTTGNGEADFKWGSTNMYTEDEEGNPVYNWEIVDRIFDTYVDRGIKPLAEIGFMPEALSTNPQPYRHDWQPGMPYGRVYTGWTYPPKDYDKWAELVYRWVSHCVDRYGKEEVESWYWELWNEPDIGYFRGTVDEYCKLWDYTVHALKRALPTAKIGGPHVAGPRGPATFLHKFLEHCVNGTNYVTGEVGSPIDFIGFHAKGDPRFTDSHVVMNMGSQLAAIERGCEILASFPTLKHLPIVIGESDPEGCAACGMYTNPENGYRNGTMFSSYTAASFARKYDIADRWGVKIIGAVSWAFEFENQPWFHGFRDLATNGVDKPVLNVFRMFGKMGGERIDVSGDSLMTYRDIITDRVRGRADVGALASLGETSLAVMVWNYHDADVAADPALVELAMQNIPATKATLSHYRIDAEHSNSYEVWKGMGSPQDVTPEQYKVLEQAGQLAEFAAPVEVDFTDGRNWQIFPLPRQGVSLLVFSWDK